MTFARDNLYRVFQSEFEDWRRIEASYLESLKIFRFSLQKVLSR